MIVTTVPLSQMTFIDTFLYKNLYLNVFRAAPRRHRCQAKGSPLSGPACPAIRRPGGYLRQGRRGPGAGPGLGSVPGTGSRARTNLTSLRSRTAARPPELELWRHLAAALSCSPLPAWPGARISTWPRYQLWPSRDGKSNSLWSRSGFSSEQTAAGSRAGWLKPVGPFSRFLHSFPKLNYTLTSCSSPIQQVIWARTVTRETSMFRTTNVFQTRECPLCYQQAKDPALLQDAPLKNTILILLPIFKWHGTGHKYCRRGE